MSSRAERDEGDARAARLHRLSSLSADPPSGFLYQPALIGESEEQTLVERIRALEFSPVRMRGVEARRKVVQFGWVYGYESWQITPGVPIPEFLMPLRVRAAGLAAVEPEHFAEVIIIEYPPGAGIGWHRDAPAFGLVVGVSLLTTGRLRFRRQGERPRSVTLEPRSAYLLDGPARNQWQHSLAPTPALRYSITFRTLRKVLRAAGRRGAGAPPSEASL
jgi:alkylated DNA repair protein (DNA oxidative demethylase)